MSQVWLLFLAAFFYAGYNLFIKVSGDHVPLSAATTISATIALQLAALGTSAVFAGFLFMKGESILGLPGRAYLWAILAGFCIGGAEIAYFYLFGGGSGGTKPLASVVIPFVVGATIIITLLVSAFIFKETMTFSQILGAIFIVVGLALVFIQGTSFKS